ncbi:hypothetical protein BBJ28_00009034 [Nothophytophthora sp. Chile5]|nr:hypothetical protein BBJ28_00009034 [Nothophytophthora sp. Chile5]
MSSLSAAQADGYYYPKEWRPEHGSINQFHKSHPLGKRAKDLASDGVLVVRFEMPFNVWCTHCETHIGRGVRFNAKKKRVGAYFTTAIWEFRLSCASCQGEMVVRTDPQQRGYDLVSGVRKKAEEFDAEQAETERVNNPEVAVRLHADPFYRLEHESEDKRAAGKRGKGLEELVELQDAQFKDDYASNSSLRAQLRGEKRQRLLREQEASRLGLTIPLLNVHPDDVLASKAVVFKNIPGKQRRPHTSASAASSARAKTSGKMKRKTTDPFEHFGDPVGAQLRRLKEARRAQKQVTAPVRSRHHS